MARGRMPGPGGLDMGALMKQAQQMQADMAKAQEELKDEVVEASAGGGMVKVKVSGRIVSSAPGAEAVPEPIILDWRKIRGHEEKSAVSNVSINGRAAVSAPQGEPAVADGGVRVPFEEVSEHLVFRDGVVVGENVIKLDFTSPILTSGSAITRAVSSRIGYLARISSERSSAASRVAPPILSTPPSSLMYSNPGMRPISTR